MQVSRTGSLSPRTMLRGTELRFFDKKLHGLKDTMIPVQRPEVVIGDAIRFNIMRQKLNSTDEHRIMNNDENEKLTKRLALRNDELNQLQSIFKQPSLFESLCAKSGKMLTFIGLIGRGNGCLSLSYNEELTAAVCGVLYRNEEDGRIMYCRLKSCEWLPDGRFSKELEQALASDPSSRTNCSEKLSHIGYVFPVDPPDNSNNTIGHLGFVSTVDNPDSNRCLESGPDMPSTFGTGNPSPVTDNGNTSQTGNPMTDSTCPVNDERPVENEPTPLISAVGDEHHPILQDARGHGFLNQGSELDMGIHDQNLKILQQFQEKLINLSDLILEKIQPNDRDNCPVRSQVRSVLEDANLPVSYLLQAAYKSHDSSRRGTQQAMNPDTRHAHLIHNHSDKRYWLIETLTSRHINDALTPEFFNDLIRKLDDIFK